MNEHIDNLRRRVSGELTHDELVKQGRGLTEDELDIFEERAAIMEFDGGLSRAEAEKEAMKEIEKRR